MKKETTARVDLYDLVTTLFSKWKVIVVSLLIGAIIGTGYGMFSSRNSKILKASSATLVQSDLSNEEALSVNSSAQIIKAYEEVYAQQEKYNEESIYQNLDAFSIDALILTYCVDNHYQVSYPIIDERNTLVPIIQMYTSILCEEEMYKKLAKEIGNDVNPMYYRELVNVNITQQEDGIFVVKVYSNDASILSVFDDCIKALLNDYHTAVENDYGVHDLTLLSDVVNKTIDIDVANQQIKNLETLTNITKKITEIKSSFSGDQLLYLNALLSEKEASSISLVKYATVCAIIGAVLAMLFMTFKYLLSDTVKTIEDLDVLLESTLLGKLDSDISYLASKIDLIAENKSFKTIAVVCNELDLDIIKELSNNTKTNLVPIIEMLTNGDSLSTLSDSDAVILVEQLRSSKCGTIIKEKDLCDNSGVEVLGYVLK